ncbi:MAG: sortase [bacterium]|nr:sortase [bacterium]
MINFVAWLVTASAQAYARKWSFLGVFAAVFLGSVIILAKYDLLPEMSPVASAPSVTLSSNPSSVRSSKPAAPEFPTKMEISKIGLAVTIENPSTTNIVALDALLLSGAVRYPTSAKLGENGNVVLFGHSSYLPIVRNQAYKAFNGIQKLAAGDIITVYSSTATYSYRVKSVTKESANDAGIPLSVTGRVLTLSTCDSFGEKSDRFVVVADFVESHSIST